VSQLLAAHANPDLAARDGIPPLVLAATHSGNAMPEALLAAGADPLARTPSGQTVLMAAAGGGDRHVVGKLLAMGAAVEAENAAGETAIYYAARHGQVPTIDVLLGAHAAYDIFSHDGMTPLMAAAEAGKSEAVHSLLRAGAQPDLRNKQYRNWTALMYAAKGSAGDVVDELARAGAHIDARDVNRETPIMIAAEFGGESTMSALLAAGADVNCRGGDDRKTPLDLAVERNDRGIVACWSARAPASRSPRWTTRRSGRTRSCSRPWARRAAPAAADARLALRGPAVGGRAGAGAADHRLHYQGRLTDGAAPASGAHQFQFRCSRPWPAARRSAPRSRGWWRR
jgi:ankyrin repeat protein